jgi:cytochrome c
MRQLPVILVLVLVALAAVRAAGAGEVERGAALYERRCGACHALDANRVGPRHRGLYGRQAGSLSDYDYSPALRDAALIWDAAALDRWLSDPEALIPGQRMGFRLGKADERRDIIAYLRRVSPAAEGGGRMP